MGEIKPMKNFVFITFYVLLLRVAVLKSQPAQQQTSSGQPTISFTFDDGSTDDMPGYTLESWNEKLLGTLAKHKIKAVLFAAGSKLAGEKGKYVLESWNNAGHKIGNHSYSHNSLNSSEITLDQYESDFMTNDSIVRKYSNFYPYFRFPYLKEGNTKEKINGFRKFLDDKNYKNGYVTIDASDWYVNSRLLKRLKENPDADISGFKAFYIRHLFGRALFYDSLSTLLSGRKISHTILLHHNFAAALFLDDLIQYFKDHGWKIINAEDAYKDKIYQSRPSIIPAGESLIWALAKQSGKFEDVLRYPGEDGDYEEHTMDELGLSR